MSDLNCNSIVAQHHKTIRGFVARLVRDEATADDLTQDVFLRAKSASNPCRDQAAAQGWLYSIALNVVRDYFRTQKRRPREVSLEESETIPQSGDNVESTVLLREMSDCVLEHIRMVPSPQQEVLVLHDMVGLTHREISVSLGVSESNARVLLHRARAAFRSIIDRHCTLSFDEDPIPCERKPSEDK